MFAKMIDVSTNQGQRNEKIFPSQLPHPNIPVTNRLTRVAVVL